ncbi:MAG: sulfite exporter TauE/SafE family protein [Granulosicoccus sp.]
MIDISMLQELLVSPDTRFLLMAGCGIYLIAGIIKGTLGIGFPTAAVSLLAQVADARTAIIVVIVPMLITNLWQVIRSADFVTVFTEHRILITLMVAGIAVFSQVSAQVPIGTLTAILGAVVVIYAIYSLLDKPIHFAPAHDKPVQAVVGLSAGVMGGMVSVWAPPILFYLRAKGLQKEQFVATVGVLLLSGSSVLVLGYWHSGVLTSGLWLISCLLVIPALAGFRIGEIIRRRLSSQRFERLLLWFFLVMGLNLIRRAVF